MYTANEEANNCLDNFELNVDPRDLHKVDEIYFIFVEAFEL